MLEIDHPYNGNESLIRHYSDTDRMIRQNETGVLYSEAVDKYPTNYTYTETGEPIPKMEVPDE